VRPTRHALVPGCQPFRRTRALGALREFPERLLGCLTARGDAMLELADAVCASPPRSWVVYRGPGRDVRACAPGRGADVRHTPKLAASAEPWVKRRPGPS
jgi:hypothetical protein